jgi:hypothetical protein
MQVEVVNIVKLFGSAEELERLRNTVDVNGLGFDFDSVIKPPEALLDLPARKLTVREEIELLSSVGYSNLLDWREDNWGTSWVNVGTSWFSNSYFKMTTMNRPPIEIFRQLTLTYDVKLYVLYTDNEKSSVMIFRNGEFAEEKSTGYEAEVVYYLTEDLNYTYERWEEMNGKASKHKKLEMKLLFNRDNGFLTAARSIINQKAEEISI